MGLGCRYPSASIHIPRCSHSVLYLLLRWAALPVYILLTRFSVCPVNTTYTVALPWASLLWSLIHQYMFHGIPTYTSSGNPNPHVNGPYCFLTKEVQISQINDSSYQGDPGLVLLICSPGWNNILHSPFQQRDCSFCITLIGNWNGQFHDCRVFSLCPHHPSPSYTVSLV